MYSYSGPRTLPGRSFGIPIGFLLISIEFCKVLIVGVWLSLSCVCKTRTAAGNYPFDPETFTDRESRAVIQSDSTTPIMACDDQDQPVLCKGDANASWNNYPAERHPDRVSQ